MMDRKYLEEHLSAYIDGELPPEKMSAFAEALKAHPDLQEELAELAALDKFAKRRRVTLPAEGYFEGLAERIEARIEREVPKRRNRVIEFILTYRRPVAVISSMAAVLLVALIGINYTGKEKILDSRTVIIRDSVAKQPPASPTSEPKTEPDTRQLLPAPELEEADDLRPLKEESAPAATPIETSKQKEEPISGEASEPGRKSAPEIRGLEKKRENRESSIEAAFGDTIRNTKAYRPVITLAEPRDSQRPETFRLTEAQQLRTEIGLAMLSKEASDREVRWGAKTPEAFEARIRGLIADGNWDAIADLPRALEEFIAPESIVAAEQRRQAAILAPEDRERGYAERAFQAITHDPFSRIFARVLIEHYLNKVEVADRLFWQARLDSLKVDTLKR